MIEVNQVGKSQTSAFKLREQSIHETILSEVEKIHGDFGVASIRPGFTSKYLNEHTRVAVIRIRRGPHKFVSSIIPLIKYIDGKRVIVNTLYLGATIKHCFFFVKTYQQRKFDEYCTGLKTEEERNQLKEVMLNFDNILEKVSR